MKNKNLLRAATGSLVALLAFNACQPQQEETVAPQPVDSLNIAQGFNFKTTQDVAFSITAKDAAGKQLNLTNVQVYDADPEQGGQLLLQGGIDQTGKFAAYKALPAYLREVIVVSNYVGLLDKVTVPVHNGSVSYAFSPVTQNAGGRVAATNARVGAGKFSYLSAFNSAGVPGNLFMPNGVVDANFLSAVNGALPEQKKINPAYVAPGLSRDLPIAKESEVTITFVSEGASFKNAMGYYTYPLDQAPTSVDQIQHHTVVFPNASFTGSGGGLAAGNQVKFTEKVAAGTGIGFFIAADGWNGTGVSEKSDVLYSNPAFNPGNASQQQHSVLLNYGGKYILGFEDRRRDGKTDEDFNDVVFYVTAEGADDTHIPPVEPVKDCDKDGVPDADDGYPCDAAKAYNNFSVGTLAYEDLWPNKGDFDMNDLVLNYRHNAVTNSQNKVVELQSDFFVVAIGARYKNGFGFELSNLSPSQLASVTSSSTQSKKEDGQQKATIIVFENAFDFAPGDDAMINTNPALAKVNGDSIKIVTTFVSPLTMQELGAAPFNPFLITNEKRGYEVHLPGYLPTSKADVSVLGTKDDVTNPANGVYYKTKEGMPFAVHLPVGEFKYPVEYASIVKTHLKFLPWAQSNGTMYADWYTDKPDYRDPSKIYAK